MVQQVVKVSILLEIVPSTVGHHSRVQYMHLTDRPRIKPCFGEQLFEQGMIADLNIARTQPQPFDERIVRDGAFVTMMQHPTDRSRFTIDRGDLEEADAFEHALVLTLNS